MADKTSKVAENVDGAYYVDTTCVPCNLCIDEAPGLMKLSEDETYAYFFKQPGSPAEEEQAKAALDICPTEAIGDDG